MIKRSDRIKYLTTSPVTGYELNPDYGFFSVIIPEATTNLITNPSCEGGVTTNYSAYGGSLAAVTTWQAYGTYGLELTPALSTESGFYYGTVSLTAGTTYTASVTVQGEPGRKYYIWFATTGGASLCKREWIGTGMKQRIWVTYTETSSTTRRIYVSRYGYADQHKFYADGLQLEAKAYPTTYCDGDQIGFMASKPDYYWNGTPGASTSSRRAQSRAGGREMNLLNYGLHLIAIIGLMMAPIVDQSLVIPGLGELPQGTGTTAREFTLSGVIPATGQRHLQAQLDDLTNAFKRDLVPEDQPLILRYQACDEDGNAISTSLDIQCKYLSGLDAVAVDNEYQANVNLTFKMYLPFIRQTYDTGLSLGFQTTVSNAYYVIKRDLDGVWSALPTSTLNSVVYTLAPARAGGLYIGGYFTNFIDANGDGVSYYDGSSFSSLSTGLAGTDKIIRNVDGSMYIVGAFTALGGPPYPSVYKWDGAALSAVGSGLTGNHMYAAALDSLGRLWVGGYSTSIAGGPGIFEMWDGSSWTDLSGAMNNGGTVEDIAVGPDNKIYVAGRFTTVGTGTVVNYIACYDPVSGTWSDLGGGANSLLQAIAFGPDGNLYAGGTFTQIGGVSASHVAMWNGTRWLPLGDGVQMSSSPTYINVIYYSSYDRAMYFGGAFDTVSGLGTQASLAGWNGSSWFPPDIRLPGIAWASVTDIAYDDIGNFYVAYNNIGNATSAITATPSISGAKVYPIITFTGPGTLYSIKNYTTQKVLNFNLTLLAGEVAVLNLDPLHLSFTSSFRGNILSTITSGSDLDFFLNPGVNNVSGYMYGSTTAATKITMRWQDLEYGIQGAIER